MTGETFYLPEVIEEIDQADPIVLRGKGEFVVFNMFVQRRPFGGQVGRGSGKHRIE